MAVFWPGAGSLAALMTVLVLGALLPANWSQRKPGAAPLGPFPSALGTGTWAEEGTGLWGHKPHFSHPQAHGRQ